MGAGGSHGHESSQVIKNGRVIDKEYIATEYYTMHIKKYQERLGAFVMMVRQG